MNLLIITFILKEFINNHIIKERTKKITSRSKVNYGKKYKVKTIVVDKSMKRDVLMKNCNFYLK